MSKGCECCGVVETTRVRPAPSGDTHEACDACNADSWETHRIDLASYEF
jgi:hypothetical protein